MHNYKVKQRELSQKPILVGDVVKHNTLGMLVVTNVNEKDQCLDVLDAEGKTYTILMKNVTKTDKHINIQKMLSQIGV